MANHGWEYRVYAMANRGKAPIMKKKQLVAVPVIPPLFPVIPLFREGHRVSCRG